MKSCFFGSPSAISVIEFINYLKTIISSLELVLLNTTINFPNVSNMWPLSPLNIDECLDEFLRWLWKLAVCNTHAPRRARATSFVGYCGFLWFFDFFDKFDLLISYILFFYFVELLEFCFLKYVLISLIVCDFCGVCGFIRVDWILLI